MYNYEAGRVGAGTPYMQGWNGYTPQMQMSGQSTPQYMPDPVPLEKYIYPMNLPQALKLISDAVTGETEDRQFYGYLLSVAPSAEDKNIISGIRDDEIGHFHLFRRIYFDLTGQTLPQPGNVTFEQPASYCAGIARAIKGEQGAVIRYRQILFAMQNRIHINMLTEIITDEIRHGILYNYIYSRNGCKV